MKKKLHFFLVSLSLFSTYSNAQQKTQLPIKSSYNDVAITTSTNAVNYTSTGLYLEGGTTAAPTETYIRFQGISLPADAVIKSANLIFYGRTASTLGTTVNIFGERGNSDVYPTSTAVTTSTSIRGRQYTTDSVTWDTPICVANKEYTTPDVTNLLLDMFPAGVGNSNVSFKLTGNQKGSFVMWSYDGNAAMTPQLQITFTSAYGTFTTTTLANTDDGRENTNGAMYLTDGFINLGGRSDSSNSVVRFPVVEIPEKAEISEAYIEFYSYGTSPASTVNIYTELANAATYATTSGNITKRNYSTNTVNWFTESWTVNNKLYQTPNLKNIIDASRLSGWQSGQAIGFKFIGTLLNNGATACTNEMGDLYKPRLVIKYKTEGNGPNVETIPLNGASASVITAGNDDAREYTNGNMALGDGYMHLSGRSDGSDTGFVFRNTQIPANAEIKDAYIEFYSYATSPATTVNIYAETGQALSYTVNPKSITARQYTNNMIHWATDAWTTDLAKNRTPNLRNIIDEIRLNGWKSGENIAFKFNGQGLNDGARAYAYEGSTLYRPRLVVEYVNNGAGPGKVVVDPTELQTYTSIVNTANDDGREYTNGSMALGDGALFLSGRTDGSDSGFIFHNTQIPANAEIKEAYIEFYSYATSPATSIDIYAEMGQKLPYTYNPKSLTARQYTNNKINWATEAWTADLAKNRTPNLRNIIDEIRLNGWKPGDNIAFKFNGQGLNDGARAYAYEGSNFYRPRLVVKFLVNGAGPSIVVDPNEIQTSASIVNTANDDGREYTNGNMALGDGALFLSGRTDGSDSGFIFHNTQIPANAEIKDAYIEFYAYATSPATTVNIYAETSQKLPYTYNLKSLTAREYTNNMIHWATDAWTTDLTKNRTPNLRNIIDEIRLNGWKSGENIAFKFNGQGLNDGARAYAYEASTLYRPRLVIKYVNNGAGPSIVAVDPNEIQTYTTIVNTGNDDGREYTNGNMALGDGALFLSGRTDGSDSGFTFHNTQIPANAEIKDAYIEFSAYATSPATTVAIYAEKSQKMPYTYDPKSLTARQYTNNKINWTTEAWTTDLAKNRTPNLRNIIDEIRLNGWKSGENIAFKFNGLSLNDGARAYAYEGSNFYRPRLVVKYLSNGAGPGIVTDPNETQTYANIVSTGYDDGRENTDGNMYLGDGYLSLAGQSDSYKTGIRFQDIEFPVNAEITEAYIEFYAYGSSNATTVSIKSEIGDAQIYSPVKNNISGRTYSQNTELWNTDTRVDYAKNRTVDIKKLIDENRLRGWESGQNLAFLFEGKGVSSNFARVRSYEASNLNRPRLVIKYKDNQKGPNAAAVICTLNNVITDPLQMNGLVINEVSAQGSVAQKEDWIEIYNNLDKTIFIDSNVSISNKDTKKDLNVLKNILIPAKGFTVLVADKKPEKGNFHINFDLKNTGSIYLSTLTGKKTTALDQLNYLETPYNASYGRSTDAAATLAPFVNPTYNLSNNVGQQKLALAFSTERGVYPTGFDLIITAPAGSTVNYTLDGKFPSKTVGTKYTVPISIKQSCVLKVYAYDATGNSAVISNTYILQDNYKNELPTDYAQWANKDYILKADEYAKAIAELPIVSISTDAELNPLWVQGSFEYLDKHIYSDHTNLFSNSTTKKFGQASLAQFNGGVKFKFNKDAEVKKANYPFFDSYPGDVYPTPNKIQVLELKEGEDGPQNNIFNTGYLRFDEKMTMNLCKELGKYALDTRYVNFFVNGKYRGVKTIRNDFSPNNLEDVFGDDADNYTTINLQDGNFPIGIVEEGDGSTAIWQNIKKLAAAKDFQGFKNWVDVEDLIKFQIMFMFTDTENEAIGIIHNYAPTFMKAKMNINDTDGAFFGGFTAPTSSVTMPALGFAGGGGNYKQKWILNDSRLGPGGLFGNFMGSNTNQSTGNLEFKTLVKDYVQAAFGDPKSMVAAPLSVSNVQTKIKNEMVELNDVYKLDAAYMSYDREVYNYWKNIDGPRVLAQVPERVSYSLQKWQEYNMVHTLLAAPFDTAVADKITITNPNAGTLVYYTIDGSDPMGKDGIVSPSALQYDASKGIVLASGTYSLVSRAFTTNNWGPLSKADVNGKLMTKRSAANISEELLNTEAKNVIIYPNPAYDEININLENSDSISSKMSIYSIDGKLVQNNSLTSQSNTVNISNLNTGYYIIKIMNDKGTVSTHKLIKK